MAGDMRWGCGVLCPWRDASENIREQDLEGRRKPLGNSEVPQMTGHTQITPRRELFGEIDIYLFDQLLKGRIQPGQRLLDASCGGGRNLLYFLRQGYEVYGVDQDPEAIRQVQRLAAHLARHLPAENFCVTEIAEMPFASEHFEVVISSAVLHFARDEQHFHRMLDEMWRVLRGGGMFFAPWLPP